MSATCPYGIGASTCPHKGIFPYDCEYQPFIDELPVDISLHTSLRKPSTEPALCTTATGLTTIVQTLERCGCVNGEEYETAVGKLSPYKKGR